MSQNSCQTFLADDQHQKLWPQIPEPFWIFWQGNNQPIQFQLQNSIRREYQIMEVFKLEHAIIYIAHFSLHRNTACQMNIQYHQNSQSVPTHLGRSLCKVVLKNKWLGDWLWEKKGSGPLPEYLYEIIRWTDYIELVAKRVPWNSDLAIVCLACSLQRSQASVQETDASNPSKTIKQFGRADFW